MLISISNLTEGHTASFLTIIRLLLGVWSQMVWHLIKVWNNLLTILEFTLIQVMFQFIVFTEFKNNKACASRQQPVELDWISFEICSVDNLNFHIRLNQKLSIKLLDERVIKDFVLFLKHLIVSTLEFHHVVFSSNSWFELLDFDN